MPLTAENLMIPGQNIPSFDGNSNAYFSVNYVKKTL